jgi:hypothetical protein
MVGHPMRNSMYSTTILSFKTIIGVIRPPQSLIGWLATSLEVRRWLTIPEPEPSGMATPPCLTLKCGHTTLRHWG